MEAPTVNSKEIETAMRMLENHRKAMMKSYHKNKDKRLAYAKAYYNKKKEAKSKEEESQSSSSESS